MKKSAATIPETLGQRIQLVGETLYWPRWRSRLATALGVSRSTLWRWVRNEEHTENDVDGALVELIDKEWLSGNARCAELADLRRRLLRHQQEAVNG